MPGAAGTMYVYLNMYWYVLKGLTVITMHVYASRCFRHFNVGRIIVKFFLQISIKTVICRDSSVNIRGRFRIKIKGLGHEIITVLKW